MATPREIRWLQRELPGWVERNLISGDQADGIRALYAERDSSRVIFVLFGVLGAAMIGGGIALLIAHNWDGLSRFDRALLCVAMLVAAQAAVAYAAIKQMESVAWREGTVVVLALTIAASIALIGQTYHLPGDGRAFLGTCMLLTLPVIYLLDSRVGAGFYLVAVLSWPGVERLEAGDRLLFMIYPALIAPYLISLRRIREHSALLASLGGLSVITLGVVVMTIVSDLIPEVSGFVWAAFAASLYAAGSDERSQAEIPGYAGAARIVGSLGMAWGIAGLCFVEAWSFFDGPNSSRFGLADQVAYALVALVVSAVWVWRSMRLEGPWHRRMATMLPVVVGLGIALRAAFSDPTASVLVMSVYGLVLGIGGLMSGVKHGAIRTANAGLALIVAVLAVRFADAEWSFVVRGLGFIALGIAFLALNARLLRARRGAES